MAAHSHFQRLKHIYSSRTSGTEEKHVAISFGRAELDASLDPAGEATVSQLPHHRLLSDVASLAAASVEKERAVSAERFSFTVHQPNYDGAVVAIAEVVLADPPRFIVQAILRGSEGELIADATGVFRPNKSTLPPDPAPDDPAPDQDEETVSPRPAAFMPIHFTPVGWVCLN
ncbi:MAG: hypothetical protein ACLFTE_00800 [Salinivenus sp.]